MIIWDTLKVQNTSNTLTIAPEQLSTTASNGFTVSGKVTVNGAFICNKIESNSTNTSTLYNLTLSDRLKFINTGDFAVTADTVAYAGVGAWSENNVISYKNCDIGYRLGLKHLDPENHWYMEVGAHIAGYTDGTALFQRIRAHRASDSRVTLNGIAFKLGKDADSLGDLEIVRWDGSTFAGFKASTIVASTKIEAPTFNSTSDRRLKTNIQPWQSKQSILDLPIYSFDYITDHSHHIGCLAQDLQQISPELVNEDKNGYLHIEESKLVYLLIQEVKQLTQRVQELEAKCHALQA